MADIHIGAHHEPVLVNLEAKAFEIAMDGCIKQQVDFILIAGDLFHVGIPDLIAVDKSVKKMKEVKEAGIPIYVIYGSHDYNPNGKSIIDILESTGLIKKIVKGQVVEDKLRLDFITDPKTNAKLTGLSARKMGLESKYFDILDRDSLEKEDGFKIFGFHSSIEEFKPKFLSQMSSIPISSLPKGFSYYAGGHVHERSVNKLPGYDYIMFPGPLFAGYPRDLERNAQGEERGFYVVHFKDVVERIEFIPIKICESTYFEYDVTYKNSNGVNQELLQKISGIDVKDKLVLLKIKGELAGGLTSDIKLIEIRKKLMNSGAIYVNINRYSLSTKEYGEIKVAEEDVAAIENLLFRDAIDTVKLSTKSLKSDAGVELAKNMLGILRQEKKESEAKKDYDIRLRKDGLKTLGLTELV
jgi:DNA repair exonuclease SbcCD nuclease subunit